MKEYNNIYQEDLTLDFLPQSFDDSSSQNYWAPIDECPSFTEEINPGFNLESLFKNEHEDEMQNELNYEQITIEKPERFIKVKEEYEIGTIFIFLKNTNS